MHSILFLSPDLGDYLWYFCHANNMIDSKKDEPQFFLTAPAPCPYLTGRYERKVFTYLAGQFSKEKNTILTQNGFRRSQNIAYRPVCNGCAACVSIRIVVNDFLPDRTMKRVMKKNVRLSGEICSPKATFEQYLLFKHYLKTRHSDGGMSEMAFCDYQLMVEDTAVETNIIEYRKKLETNSINDAPFPLVAAVLTDIVADGLSMIYSFFSPEEKHSSLGVFVILDHIRRAKELGLPYVYLGYWVKGSQKMDYKSRFRPQEHLTSYGWKPA